LEVAHGLFARRVFPGKAISGQLATIIVVEGASLPWSVKDDRLARVGVLHDIGIEGTVIIPGVGGVGIVVKETICKEDENEGYS
jgi:hypothetical protein